MAIRRSHGPYIWLTWLSKLLAGETVCPWSVWFRANHDSGSWQPIASDFDEATWKARHTRALTDRATRFTAHGLQVRLEDQNAFRLRGKTAALGGKPDIIASPARDATRGTVVDVKTGRPKASDIVQVQL